MDAARVNGINGHFAKYMNVAGDWKTWRDVDDPHQIPERFAQLTAAFFGVKGLLDGRPTVSGVLGIIISVHALEHITGAAATMLARGYVRGQPLGAYRGVTLRRGPGQAPLARLVNQVTGRQTVQTDSLYFFESGRTWHSQTITVPLGDEERTLTTVRSYSIPHREYYFDRPVAPQNVVDIVKGDLDPDSLPGFIGSVNELEDLTVTAGAIKRAFFVANWLLLDPGERDGGGLEAEAVDYQALVKGIPPADRRPEAGREPGSPSIEINRRRAPGPPPVYPTMRPVDASRTAPGAIPVPGLGQGAYGADLFGRKRPQTVRIGGQDRPLVIRRVVKGVFSGQDRADAAWYDADLGRWRIIDDDDTRSRIAGAVAAGDLHISPGSDWPF